MQSHEDGAVKPTSKTGSKSGNRNSNVWTTFDWVWFKSIMNQELQQVQTRIPNDCKRKWNRNRWESVSVDDTTSNSDASEERGPKRSIFSFE
jgi:hypothetical protein